MSGQHQSGGRIAGWMRRARLFTGSATVVLVMTRASAQEVAAFDLTSPGVAAEWRAVHDVARLQPTDDGLRIEVGGADPYLHGPPENYPSDAPLWLELRVQSDQPGTGQVFFFTDQQPANEGDSVRFPVPGGSWQKLRVPVRALGPGWRLRFDPPGGPGNVVTLARITLVRRVSPAEPVWPRPCAPELGPNALSVRSGDLELRHDPARWDAFEVWVGEQRMGTGLTRPLFGYRADGETVWIDAVDEGAFEARRTRRGIETSIYAPDLGSGVWRLSRRIEPGELGGSLAVTIRLTVGQDREAVFVPMFVLLPGLGSFGHAKEQALLAGLEYLGANEPSSSEADIIGPGSRRRVPDAVKQTLPLAAIVSSGKYVGLIWEPRPEIAAVFDSPDRAWSSESHLMGLICPGSNGTNRDEGSLLPYAAVELQADQPLEVRVVLIGGEGRSVVPAVRQYVALRGLPALPDAGTWDSCAGTLAAGWLDSAIREEDRYRHAYPGAFGAHPAADAAAMMDWLAMHINEGTWGERLRHAAADARAGIAGRDMNTAGVSHVRPPAAALVYGHGADSAARAQEIGYQLLGRFEPDGSVPYRAPPTGPDYSRTHFAPDANGHTARIVAELLEAAVYCGDRRLQEEALRMLRALAKFDDSVPRGAQTWEIPLHTPDILASAHLVRAFTLGYELTGDEGLLERARYWAWTGVTFVYLVPPTEHPVGVYATVPVLGATGWSTPNWMGLPVQWCGLVYADALYRLALYDADGPWLRLADGITASGVQQTWPTDSNAERQGLLPDSYSLRAQIRNDVAINPGTVQANAIRLHRQPLIYDYHVFRRSGMIVHSPGALREVTEGDGCATFTVDGWPAGPYEVLVVGLAGMPEVEIDGRPIVPDAPHSLDPATGRMVLRMEGRASVRIAVASSGSTPP